MRFILKAWARVARHSALVALLDFILLALASYLGYAIRLSLFLPASYVRDCVLVALVFPALTVAIFACFGQYKTLWPQAGLEDYVRFAKLYVTASAVFFIINLRGVLHFALLPRTSLTIMLFAGILLCGGLRVSWRLAFQIKNVGGNNSDQGGDRQKTLIIGAGEAGALLVRDLIRSGSQLEPAAFVDDDADKLGMQISGVKVIGNTSQLPEIIKQGDFKIVLIAIPSIHGAKIRTLYEQLAPLGVQVRLLPSLHELAGGSVSVKRLRKVRLEDLLGRDPVQIDLDESMNYIQGRRVLVTGAGGSIGSEIVRQVIKNNPSELLLLGHGEQSIYLLLESLAKSNITVPIHPVIADVADEIAIRDLFDLWEPQVVFHAAAHKHVPLMEFSPREALRVNGLGTRTIAQAAGEHGAERMVMISTDKAVNPSSIMGASKRVAEKMLELEQSYFPNTAFMAVRFGNVLGSRGSVIPKFEKQIASGGPVTVTASGMTRYFMLIPEAVSLVIQAGAMGKGGELFVLDMGEPVSITEMAELLIRLCGYEPYRDIQIVFTGIRPGEKLNEELFYDPTMVRPTRHPKIFASTFASASASDSSQQHKRQGLTERDAHDILAMLKQAIMQPDMSLELLRKLVPEYTPAATK